MVMGMNGNERRRVIGDKVRVEGVKSDSAANGRSKENEGDGAIEEGRERFTRR